MLFRPGHIRNVFQTKNIPNAYMVMPEQWAVNREFQQLCSLCDFTRVMYFMLRQDNFFRKGVNRQQRKLVYYIHLNDTSKSPDCQQAFECFVITAIVSCQLLHYFISQAPSYHKVYTGHTCYRTWCRLPNRHAIHKAEKQLSTKCNHSSW